MTEISNNRPRSKVARLLSGYEIEEFGAELEAKWTSDGVERLGLRKLADLFNKRLLEEQMREGGMRTLDQDIDQIYENLTSDDVSSGVSSDTRVKLEENGIDIDALESDFVTYQAIRTYLKEWRGAEYHGLSDEEKIAKDIESIRRLTTRTRSVTEERIQKLRTADRIDVDEFEILLSLQILCQRCGTQYAIDEFLRDGGCDCLQNEG